MNKYKNNWISFFYIHKKQLEFLARELIKDKNIPLTVDDFIPEAMDEIKQQLDSQKEVNISYILKACEYRFRNIIKKYTSKKHNVLNNAYYYEKDELFDIAYEDKYLDNLFLSHLKSKLKLTKTEEIILDNYFLEGQTKTEIFKKYHISPYYQNSISRQLTTKITNII
ncbi:hypothetical protein [Mycoplasma zalophi]|uniref:Sigma-70 family RNA polymerase sigma factor n=1 Tax=Mycoplasma zalophi TaxID=191287 RepID=A0ABS6DP68_9MOLU|nr:hypothetical protein [Mycoplasma zalophi]MBU4691231.1 hypothetical protein [Mycoplasma zalophi]MBU4691994.1 hypothetical protein [Mycoplasma zalophi]